VFFYLPLLINLSLVFTTVDENKPILMCAIPEELVTDKNLNAGKVIFE